jgi:hypothetical protein
VCVLCVCVCFVCVCVLCVCVCVRAALYIFVRLNYGSKTTIIAIVGDLLFLCIKEKSKKEIN